MKLNPFVEADLEEAAELLARRHQNDRAHEQALPERFTQPLAARTAIEKTWHDAHQSGVVARHEGQLIGYLIGVPKTSGPWGRGVWVELPGHAIDPTFGAEVYRDLYAAISPSWVSLGFLAHYALIPASDRDALEAWFALSFGKEQTHGIRETAPASAFDVPADPTLEIRQAGLADLDASLELDDIIPIQHSRSPVYAPFPPYDREEVRQESIEILENKQWKLWLAFRNGRVVGCQLFIPAKPGPGTADMLYSEQYSCLAIGATREEEQGRGVGRALTAHGLAADHAAGYTHCITDWRATNLLSSRFWPRQGFRPVAYRLSRRLDENILWAHGHPSPSPWLAPNTPTIPFNAW